MVNYITKGRVTVLDEKKSKTEAPWRFFNRLIHGPLSPRTLCFGDIIPFGICLKERW
jgi:hypothetical protein